jgi:hypothetical protein
MAAMPSQFDPDRYAARAVKPFAAAATPPTNITW